ncbi:MAG: SMC family ATPase [Bifidobacteriaceae bacterium]|jgi:exonuclease SbcC|nr:SMC family ATPase [Bifidobacteriaceae bacterium]
MRLHRLVFSAVGPFAGQVEIDFHPLSRSGLFLLEGPTGAGKSTVLDAIVFALFGGLADDSSDKHRLRSDYAASDAESFVDLIFEVNSGIYRVRRTPGYERPKRRSSGVVTVQQTARLWRLTSPAAGTQELVSGNVAEAAREVPAILGLTRTQFVQTVVLPQGQFAQFLRSGSDERRVLLQQIFGTEFYQRLVEELKSRRLAVGKELDQLAGAVRRATDQLVLAASLEEADADALHQELDGLALIGQPEAAAAAAAQAASVTVADVQRALAEAQVAADQAAGATAEAQAIRDEAAAKAKNAALREELSARLTELEAGAKARSAAAGALDAARRAQSALPLVKAMTKAAAELTGAEAVATNLGLAADVSEVRPFQTAQEAAALAEGRALEQRVAAAQLEQAQAAEAAAAKRDRAALTTLDAQQSRWELARQAAETAGREAPRLQAEVERLTSLSRKLGEQGKAQVRLDKAAQTATQAKAAFDSALATEVAAREARLAGIAGEMAAKLAPDEPCPVCGSTEHPEPAEAGADAVSLEDVAAAEASRKAAEAAYEQAGRAAQEADAVLAELTGQTGRAEPQEVAAALAAATQQLADLGELDALTAAATRAQAGVETAKTEAAAAEAALAQAHDQVIRLRERSSGAGDLPTAEAALKAAQAAKTQADRELEAVRRLLEARRSAKAAEAAAEQAITAAGFASVPAAQAADLPELETERIAAELTAAAAELLSLRERLAESALADAMGDRTALQAEAERLAEAADAARANAQAAEATLAVAKRVAAQTQAAAGALEASAKTLAQARVATAPLVRLAELTAGGAGNLRGVDLTTYVLVRRFEEVIAAANERLGPMSTGRYVLEYSEDKEVARQRRTGLALRVRDNQTGEARAPRTLSGGETFYVSLALALGLADVVTAEAGGTSMETLFVDEGFGSLDNESLEAVLSQLVRLRQGGRVVGLVSHVEALKQAIPERIEVRPTRDKGSTLTVRA